MENEKINEIMDSTIAKVREVADANTILGKPVQTPDGITVIPVSKVSIGFVTGGSSGSKGISFTGGNGGGVKVEPIGFFVIKDGTCRMINVAPPPLTTVDRVVEMVPDVLDRIDGMLNKDKTE